MIRDFDIKQDPPRILAIHGENNLPLECLPKLLIPDPDDKGKLRIDPLFVVNRVMMQKERMAIAAFARGTAEIYLILNHAVGTPQERWAWLQEMTKDMRQKCTERGLNDFTAWVPPDIDKSFGGRMEDLGFIKSPWQSYTMLL